MLGRQRAVKRADTKHIDTNRPPLRRGQPRGEAERPAAPRAPRPQHSAELRQGRAARSVPVPQQHCRPRGTEHIFPHHNTRPHRFLWPPASHCFCCFPPPPNASATQGGVCTHRNFWKPSCLAAGKARIARHAAPCAPSTKKPLQQQLGMGTTRRGARPKAPNATAP